MKIRAHLPGQRRWVNRAVTREVDRLGARWLWGLSLGVFLALTPAALFQFHQNECLRLSYEVSDLRSERERLIEEERRLSVRHDALASLASIETWALEKDGMVRPTAEQQVVVSRSAVRGETDLVAQGQDDWTAGGTSARRD